MRRIYGIGETVLDIIFKKGQPQAAKAGGSILNSVVSIGRMALPVYFISEYGLDDVGNLIDGFLRENGVNTSLVHRFENGKTALALAFLDEKNDAHYSFYKDYPEERLNIIFKDVGENDIILCGSFYSIWSEVRGKFREFVLAAKEKGAIIIYDPNFRKAHLDELDKLRPFIIENMQMANLVRGSNEDFINIFGSRDIEEAYKAVKQYCPILVYTVNVKGVFVRTPYFSGEFPVQKITPISTIGAGDNFNAGMITSIYHNNIHQAQLEEMNGQEWLKVISMAVDFATHVCLSYENYISSEFARDLRIR